jgi:hypothetical protein
MGYLRFRTYPNIPEVPFIKLRDGAPGIFRLIPAPIKKFPDEASKAGAFQKIPILSNC